MTTSQNFRPPENECIPNRVYFRRLKSKHLEHLDIPKKIRYSYHKDLLSYYNKDKNDSCIIHYYSSGQIMGRSFTLIREDGIPMIYFYIEEDAYQAVRIIDSLIKIGEKIGEVMILFIYSFSIFSVGIICISGFLHFCDSNAALAFSMIFLCALFELYIRWVISTGIFNGIFLSFFFGFLFLFLWCLFVRFCVFWSVVSLRDTWP